MHTLSFELDRYIRLLTNVLEWQQTHSGPIQVQVKCEDIATITRYAGLYHHGSNANLFSLRTRARLRRGNMNGAESRVTFCDRNGNNLLMIAPNNHLPFKKGQIFSELSQNGGKNVKIEQKPEEGSDNNENERDDNK